jgi:pimeloyl-ACP methyl ester carboxylesterase
MSREREMEVGAALGEVREVSMGQGSVRYRDVGRGEPILFVHGVLVNCELWGDVVVRLSGRFRCVVPDLPLGEHSVALGPEAEVSPRGVAKIVADFMKALDLRDVTLVGNDTGGAVCQIVIANHPERIGRLVLTNCDAYEAFFPLLLRPFHYGARFLGTRFTDLLAWSLRARTMRGVLLATVARRRVDNAVLDAYFAPLINDPGVRRDLTRFLAWATNCHTLEAARSFPGFRRPVLIVWGEDDIFFLGRYARRLEWDFPDATLEFLPGSRTFVLEDRPERLAELIETVLRTRARRYPVIGGGWIATDAATEARIRAAHERDT